MPYLCWPTSFLPVCRTTGVFPMNVPGCNRSYGTSRASLGGTTAIHLHDYSGDFFIGKTHYRLEPGDITLSPAGMISRYELKESGSHLCLHFLPPKSCPRLARIRLPLHMRLGAQTSAARDRFWRVIDYTRQAAGRSDSVAARAGSAALQELLLWLALRTGEGRAARRDSRLEHALRKLRATIDASIGRPASIAELAAGAGLSPAYLARAFARRYDMSVQHYLLQRRIEQARHLLTASNLPIAEIGRRVGLPDPQYFNKQFRRVAGVSPLAYRRESAHHSQV